MVFETIVLLFACYCTNFFVYLPLCLSPISFSVSVFICVCLSASLSVYLSFCTCLLFGLVYALFCEAILFLWFPLSPNSRWIICCLTNYPATNSCLEKRGKVCDGRELGPGKIENPRRATKKPQKTPGQICKDFAEKSNFSWKKSNFSRKNRTFSEKNGFFRKTFFLVINSDFQILYL